METAVRHKWAFFVVFGFFCRFLCSCRLSLLSFSLCFARLVTVLSFLQLLSFSYVSVVFQLSLHCLFCRFSTMLVVSYEILFVVLFFVNFYVPVVWNLLLFLTFLASSNFCSFSSPSRRLPNLVAFFFSFTCLVYEFNS